MEERLPRTVPRARRAVFASDFAEGGLADGVRKGRNWPSGGAAARARPGTTEDGSPRLPAPAVISFLWCRCMVGMYEIGIEIVSRYGFDLSAVFLGFCEERKKTLVGELYR